MHPLSAFMAALGHSFSDMQLYTPNYSGGPSTWRHHRISPRRSTVAHAKRQATRRNNIRKHGR